MPLEALWSWIPFNEQAKVLLAASRFPSGWCPPMVLFGIGLVHSRRFPKTHWKLFFTGLELILMTFPLCIIVYGLNDVHDYESDRINPRKQENGLEGGILAPEYHDLVILVAKIAAIIIIISTSLTRNVRHVFISFLFLLLVWQYSSPPLRLKEVPILDSLSNGLIVFFAWLMGYTFGGGTFYNMRREGITVSLCCVGMHALAAALDFEYDNYAGMTTIATTFGKWSAAFFAFLAFLIATITNNNINPIFKGYLAFGSLIMAIPLFYTEFLRFTFRAIVWWSTIMTGIWFIDKARFGPKPSNL
ncbi:hypothetical protein M422DRAFT_24082 [Sphaerobolus stellatus SS14]|nr:hypothetical protein M422DRAFT_24082 [Sphaerobolus stellatus SS14]